MPKFFPFYFQGFLLAQKPRKQGYGLVPINLVEVHEHEFGNLRDMDDFGGSQASFRRCCFRLQLDKVLSSSRTGMTCGVAAGLPDGRCRC